MVVLRGGTKVRLPGVVAYVMSDRLASLARWPLAALLLSIPLAWLSTEGPSGPDVVPVGLFLCPWGLAALGLAFRVPAARGFALGVSALGFCAYVLASELTWPGEWREALLFAQGTGLVLALPVFGRVFGDGLRVRWTAAAVGFAIPAAVLFAFFSHGSVQCLSWGAVALIGLGVIGLAFQRTWSLFALLAGAIVIGVVPFLLESDPFVASLDGPVEIGWLAAGALASAWLPWLAPVARRLTRD